MLLSLFLVSLSIYRLKISTSVERSSVAPPCAPAPPPRRPTPVPAPTGGAARLTFTPPTSLCPFFVSQLHVWDANSPSVTKKSQHDHARSYHPLLIPHLRTISVVPRLVVSALTGEMGDWVCLSPAEFSQLQQYSECEYLSTRSLSPLAGWLELELILGLLGG